MKRKVLLGSAVIPALLASSAMGQVINFMDVNQGEPITPAANFHVGDYYNELFAGQGAYSDPGNNIWNGFVDGFAYQSTDVYGGAWPQQAGNPGNPYAAFDTGSGWVTSDGTNLFEFSGSATNSGDADSSGSFTPITLGVTGYSSDTSIVPNLVPNGAPVFLFSSAAYNPAKGGFSNIVFTLQNVPPGAYGLYLYGVSPDNNSGTAFSVSSGTAHNGISATLNSGAIGAPPQTYVEGQTFVIFENVTPNSSSNIVITATPNPLNGVGNSNIVGNTYVNGFQLIIHPPPTAQGMTAAQNVFAGGTANFSFSPAFATSPTFQWQSVIGGVTNNISSATTTNLIIPSVGAANVGLYQCVITTATATNTSPAAPLIVLTSTATGPLVTGDPTSTVGNILQPGDSTSMTDDSATFTNYIDVLGEVYNSVPPPFNMTYTNLVDNTLLQYVNLGSSGDSSSFSGPVGIIVTPLNGSTIVTGLRLFTANSHPEDDPADYLLEGSIDGGTNFTTIAGGLLSLPAARNAAAGPINITNDALQEIDFPNTIAYTTYRLTFTNVVNDTVATNGMQLAELQLLGSFPPVPPSIAQQPFAHDSLFPGETLIANVVVGGPGPLSYEWFYNTSTPVPSATNATLTLPNLSAANAGSYSCKITNPYGTTNSATLVLTVVSPTPYETAVLADQPVCYYPLNETSGTLAYEYVSGSDGTYGSNAVLGQAGIPNPPFLGFSTTDFAFDVSGTETDSWVSAPFGTLEGPNGQTIPNITFTCWIYPVGTQNTSAGIIMTRGGAGRGLDISPSGGATAGMLGYVWNNNDPDSYDYVSNLSPPDSQWSFAALTISPSQAVFYLLNANGRQSSTNAVEEVNPPMGNQWRIGNDAAGDPSRNFNGNIAAVAVFPSTLSSAQINALYDSGAYATTNAPPVVSVPTNPIAANVGGNATIPAMILDGTPPFTYQWYYLAGTTTNVITGATSNTLTLTDITTAESSDNYFVVASNAYGSGASSFATLNILSGGPTVVTDITPLLNYVLAGQSISFSVAAGGTQPFIYQWFTQSGPIASATNSSYTFSALAGSNNYYVTISNASGGIASSTAIVVGSATLPPAVAFNGNGTDWTMNQGTGWPGSPSTPNITDNLLTLTDGENGEASSAFFNTPQSVGAFVASFTYQLGGGSVPPADGMTFCLQNDPAGAATVGGGGGGLGVTSISPCAAFEFNIYTGDHAGPWIIFGTDGNVPDNDALLTNTITPLPVNLDSGDPIFVQISYAQGAATMILSDATAQTTFETNFITGDIPTIVSNQTAYVGFTGGSGALGCIQKISGFTYQALAGAPALPTLSIARGTVGSVVVSWPVAGSTSFVLQQSTLVNGPWSNVSTTPVVVGSDNQVTLTPGATTAFYRLFNP